ncbi:MAG: 3-hydroxyacyl-CoA dehydrogenase family protein, partial [Bacteroidetes bacterium]|nr:3-hydroxyacyl-CoA dehydrogenase family protein [Bacteroidota bacterium]
SDEALAGVMRYLKAQILKIAEKKVNALRAVYAERRDLIDNDEIIAQYIFDVMNVVRPTTRLEAAYDSNMVFEAIKEDSALKIRIFSQINLNNPNQPWFFTNTSSIPITVLDEGAGLGGRIIGFHFYNPPAVQKLVEVIRSKQTLDEVNEFALAYAKNLRKVVVPARDIAGFIGNGHFMRDILYAVEVIHKMMDMGMSITEAIYAVNKVGQEYLVRPMGIFQLIDYVGVDVCSFIMFVMNPFTKDEEIHSKLLEKLLGQGVKGGQYSDGSQKDGILKYEKGKIVAVYDPLMEAYIPVSGILAKVDEKLGAMPVPPAWKSVVGNKGKDDILKPYFAQLRSATSPGAEIARDYVKKSKEIGRHLVSNGVAFNDADVNTVLLTGFFHAYGPINEYLD